ncbi:MAG: MotA/TolQ/ExbB proton channel family protein [Acidobacteria bacterium]|nr:MotA/TolQ/ExbB proton channel family protein [Acidobacteriota bacterium]
MIAPTLALLLQAVDSASATESAVESAEAVEAALSAATSPENGFLDLVLQGSLSALLVLGILAAFSVASWAIVFSKSSLLKTSRKNDGNFLKTFRRVGQLAELNAASEQFRPAPLVTVFEFGYEEVARQVNQLGKLKNGAALERCLQLGINEEVAHLQKNMGWLATTASATPFIGLFGTVLGVLEAFRGLGEAGGATLRAVAPGIAEALIATAFGLFAAIPALIFFNMFSQRIREIRARMQDFGLEFYNLAERSYGETDGVHEPERAGRIDR